MLNHSLAFSQDKLDINGIWQLKMNGKMARGSDFRKKMKSPFNRHFFYFIFKNDNFYVALNPDRNITQSKIEELQSQKLAEDGNFKIFNHIDSIPEETRWKFEKLGPLKQASGFLIGKTRGELMYFYLKEKNRNMIVLINSRRLELQYLGQWANN